MPEYEILFTKLFLGASHCADLSSNSANDSARMLEVRSRIFYLARLWAGLAVPV